MAEKNYRVTQLPPTIGIKDPEVRMYLDALTNAWDHRSGNTDGSSPDRFITAAEFKGLATSAMVEALSSSLPGGAPGTESGGSISVGEVITSISDDIKRSLLYQILGTEYPEININELQSRVDAAFGQANTLFAQERTERSNQYESITQQFTIQASRLTAAESAITSETSTRVNKDNALASAINNIWSKMGGSSAVIQDGALAAATPSTAQATKWDQVQAAVTDPNTGLINSTSIKEELNSYANLNDGTLNSTYTVRATVVSGGRTIVGGFGLMATNGAGSGAGPSINFGVRADQFWVGSLSGVGDIPFVVNTSPTTINGVTRPAGTYIKDAFIANGVIDNAKIGVAAIDTLKIGGGSVTSTTFGSGGGGSVAAGGSAIACSAAVTMPAGSSGVVITVTVAVICPTSEATAYVEIIGSNGFSRLLGISLFNGFYNSATISGFDPSPIVGSPTTYSLRVSSPTSGPGANKPLEFAQPSIIITGAKR